MSIFVHCRIKPGGALNVLEALIRKEIQSGQNVDAIFTLYSDRDYLEVIDYKGGGENLKPLKIPIITALPYWLNSIFRRADRVKPRIISSFLDYRNLMPFFPELMIVLSKKLKAFDTSIPQGNNKKRIIISSYAVAKNIDIPSGRHSTIYFHQPMHYIWTLYNEYIGVMNGRKKRLYSIITPRLRKWDSKYRHYDTIYSNSENTKAQIKNIYYTGNDTISIQVVHPPIEQRFFEESITTLPDNYFFYINRLTKMFKHLDKIILLCNKHTIPLLIAGDGPDKEYLMSIAGPTITFVGRISNIEDKITLMKRSRGVLNIAHESFGIVTAEALLLGVPVFGYNGGATPELIDKRSGMLTPSIDSDTMSRYFTEFTSTDRDRQYIQDRAKKLFSPQQEFRNK